VPGEAANTRSAVRTSTASLRRWSSTPIALPLHGGRKPALGANGQALQPDQPARLAHAALQVLLRMSNAGISKLAHLLPLGTPVDIHP
jgi:hypothetical protein